MKRITLAILLAFPLSVLGQNEDRTPQLPDWVLVLAQLGDLYQQWCEDKGGTYARDDNHQLGPGGQWKCYDSELERPQRG